MLYFIGGIIIGILLSILAFLAGKKFEIHINSPNYEVSKIDNSTQFFEPVSIKEKHLQAKNIDDLLK